MDITEIIVKGIVTGTRRATGMEHAARMEAHVNAETGSLEPTVKTVVIPRHARTVDHVIQTASVDASVVGPERHVNV
jgi:hypothetical protein